MSTESPIHVLYVDCDSEVTTVVRDTFEREAPQFKVHTASSAEAGLTHLDESSVDCIVSEADLPEKDGVQFLRDVREAYSNLPFILFTGRGNEAIASEAISASVTDYFRKTGDSSQYTQLADRIKDSVSQYRSRRKAKSAHEEELRETKRRLDLVLEKTGTGIWTWKIGTGEIEWDETLERMFGLEPGSFEGTYEAFAKRVHPDDIHRVEEAMDQAIEDDELYHTEFRMVHDDGEVVWAEVQGVLIEGDSGLDRLMGLYHEITDRKRREQQLEAFASVVSHDLRNPLGIAQGYLDLIGKEYESEHIDKIADAHEQMEVLIEELLTLARQGDSVGETEEIDLEAVVNDCWQNVKTSEATLEIKASRRIQADRTRLQQLMENLVRNAVEHGGETVTITVGELENGFFVEDDGPGVPAERIEEVFKPGYSTAERGTGFGLSIVKEIADAHGWVLTLTEGSDGGARFEFTSVDCLD